MRLSLRATQLLGYTLVVSLMGTFTIYAGLSFISETVVKEAKLRVQMDLNSAWSAYNEEKALLQMVVSLIAQNENIRCALNELPDQRQLSNTLEELRKEYNLDFLSLVNSNRYVIAGAPSAQFSKRKVRSDPVIEHAFYGKVITGTSIISQEDLYLKSKSLAERSYIHIVSTERARPTDRSFENRGMILETAVPILKSDKKVCGVIYGGILLNRKYDLVDRIRKAVFDTDMYDGKPLGTVTIFLWDTRIATNVIKMDSTRAIGTRVSDEVYTTVLERGERFGDRAFVVNDWYLSAYDPIRNPDGTIIGILYVGLLEKKYLDYKSDLTLKFIGVGVLALILSTGLATYFSTRIRIPILKLVEGTRKISSGDLGIRVNEISSTIEISELSHSFNAMAESLEIRSKQLEEASRRLQEAYTRADDKNRSYLEMLGFVTHELKSPLASIVFAIGSMRDNLLGPLTPAQEAVLKSSAKSADYLNSTIANFLNLSRIEEGELKLKLWKVSLRNTIIDPAIQRLSEMAADNSMKFDCEIPHNIEITCDPNLLTSVFQNLISNAIKYGNRGSQIQIRLEAGTETDYEISIFNEGSGFKPEEAKGLFTKFARFNTENYNTKSGTGLGLFVTKKIIKNHHGNIWAESEPGKWAKFTLRLPKRITRVNQST